MAVEHREPSFGQLLRELRMAAALTQEELAEEAGLSLRGISDLERGERRNPRIVTVRRLATALRLESEERTALESAARPKNPALAVVLPLGGLGGQLTSFVGRSREQAEVTRLLDLERLVTLTGVGGIGKTRLALAVAERAAPDCADNAVLVELAALSDPLLVARELAAAVGVRESSDRPILEALLAALQDRHVLVVLDNCEHLLGACAALVGAVLASCPHVRILATSREPLGAVDEMVYTVPPLAVDASGPVPVDRLAVFGAVQLFVDRARAVWPTFELSDQNAQAVARVCHRLDGIPLAIELAAARTRMLSIEQIEARLDDRYRLLAWGAPNAPARHQTLLAAVDWSYALLSEAERLLFDRLSIFRGGCTLEAAEAVCSTDGLESDAILDVLQSLVEKSLVLATPGADGVVRFGQLETLRDYARTRATARGETAQDALRARHLVYFRDLVERAERGLRSADERAWLDRLDRDHDNVRAALAWVLERAAWLEDGLRLAGRVWRFWVVRGHVLEGRRWLEELLANTGPTSPNVRAKALDGAGVLAFQNADYDAALERHQEALVLVRPLGDQQCIASVLSHLGSSMSVRGDLERAQTLFEQSLAAFRASDDQAGVATVLVNLAITARAQGKTDAAHAFFIEALELFRALKIRGSEANTLHGLGNIAHDRDDRQLATTYYRDALALAQQVQDWGCVARCLESLAATSALDRQLVRAAQLYGAAEVLREDIGIPITGPRREKHDTFIDSMNTGHDPAVLASAWKRGRASSRERAVKFALGS